MRSVQCSIQAPTQPSESVLNEQFFKTHLVKSFSFNTINTLLGSLLRTSNTEMSTPSFCTTALRIASLSSSVCFARSIMLDPRLKLLLSCVSGLSVNVTRPVIATSKTEYCHKGNKHPLQRSKDHKEGKNAYKVWTYISY